MELQSVCDGIAAPKLRLSPHHCIWPQVPDPRVAFKDERFHLGVASKRGFYKGLSFTSEGRGFVTRASAASSSADGMEEFRGKSGSVSFSGLDHRVVEEAKLVSAPFDEEKSSFLWVLGPVALISSLILPQFLVGPAVEAFIKNEVLVEIVASFASETMFYIGLGAFLRVTHQIQRPYLQFSPKRWSLITGLRGYLTSAFFVMGFKVVAPLFVAYVSWPMLGLTAVVAVAPFLVGCIAQRAFEMILDKRGSSCWPLVPIIFEVYRLYQLTKAAHFIEKLMFAMRGLPESATVLERNNALISMIVTFQVLGLVCLWSLVTFLLRLFPSRPVAENY